MGNRTVKDFEFPASFGFTGSGGKTVVKGYMRGGKVNQDKGGKVKHDDRAEDLKLIRSEIERAEKREEDSEGMKKGGRSKKKGRRASHVEKPQTRAPLLASAPAPRGVPAFNPEPMIPMKRGGKTKC